MPSQSNPLCLHGTSARFRLGAAVLLLAILVSLSACGTSPYRPTERALDQASRQALNEHQILAERLQAAQQAVLELKPEVALKALNAPLSGETPDSLRLVYHQLRAEAYALSGDHLASARERVWMGPLLANTDRRYNNQTLIWETLSRLSDADLQRLYRSGRRDALFGWMELVRLSRQYRQQPETLSRAIGRWSKQYPGHPANDGLLREILAQSGNTQQGPIGQVALLLPLSGALANAGIAVRDGFLAANFNQRKGLRRPAVRVYDVGQGPHMVGRQLNQAVADGADIVVGPLSRAAVTEVARANRLSVPVLALNYAENDRRGSRNMYQFGLSPEDEARDVAWRARLDEHQTVLALVPQGNWGQRVLNAFQKRWSELGGELLEVQTYDAAKTDFSVAIRDLLNLTESRARHRSLRQLLNRTLEFEPRRRKDVDFIFLVALPEKARQLGPQLRFHQAANVPVYSTSHIYSGLPDPQRNQDLNGIRFCDMPWVLENTGPGSSIRNQLLQAATTAQKRQTRLHALGVDAYNILPYLDKLGDGAFSRFNGMTGNLYMDNKRRIHRELKWARFKNGSAKQLRPGRRR